MGVTVSIQRVPGDTAGRVGGRYFGAGKGEWLWSACHDGQKYIYLFASSAMDRRSHDIDVLAAQPSRPGRIEVSVREEQIGLLARKFENSRAPALRERSIIGDETLGTGGRGVCMGVVHGCLAQTVTVRVVHE